MEKVKRYVSGQHTPVEIRWHLAALAVVYWVLILCTWLGYPAENEYSITTHTMSALGSFEEGHNPEWFWVFSIAMVYCGLTMIPIMLYYRRLLTAVSRSGAWAGALFFLVGCAGMILTGLFPDAHSIALHTRFIGDWQWRDLHAIAAGLIAVGFPLGVIWYGALLLRDKFKKGTFAERGKRPYLKLLGPFLVCLPIFVITGSKIRWGSVYAALQAAASASWQEIESHLVAASKGLQGLPVLEHVAIWVLTVFVIWFAVVLPFAPVEQEEA